MSSIYDMLDIDETEGIDATEIEAIKATLSRIKVVAAGVAKDNDTTDTLAILKEVERVVRRVVDGGVHSVDELHQQLATNSTGRPAKALGGTGSTSPMTLQEALDATPHVTNGMKIAIAKILNVDKDDKANYMAIDYDGTPTELKNTRVERETQKVRADKAEKELAETKDESKDGSLAKQLKDAKAGKPATTPFDETKVRAALIEALAAVDSQKVHRMKGIIEGDDTVKEKIGDIGKAAGLKPKTS